MLIVLQLWRPTSSFCDTPNDGPAAAGLRAVLAIAAGATRSPIVVVAAKSSSIAVEKGEPGGQTFESLETLAMAPSYPVIICPSLIACECLPLGCVTS